MILHNVSDDAKLIKVPTSPLGPEGLFKGDYNRGDIVSIPCWAEQQISEPQGH